MIGIGDLPDFIYIDEPRVNQRLQFVNEGQVAELVETSGEHESKASGGGLNIYKVLNYNREKSTGETEEVVRTIQNTPTGKLSIFFSFMDQELGVTDLDDVTVSQRDELQQGDYVVFSGIVEEPPISKLMRLSEKYGLDLRQIIDFSDTEATPEALFAELEDARNYYSIQMSDKVNGRFVFRLDPENMTGIERQFPSQYKEYTVFGRIEHLFEGNERQYHLSIFNEMSAGSRRERTKRRQKMKSLASDFSQLYDQDTGESMFYIESPDILINPISI
ncbi:hypothetical protein C439_14339, partial [Haloferax mediterranei ATCC 33500]